MEFDGVGGIVTGCGLDPFGLSDADAPDPPL